LIDKRANIRFIIIFGFVWTGFGIFGLIEAPQRPWVTASQFVAGAAHFFCASILFLRNSKPEQDIRERP